MLILEGLDNLQRSGRPRAVCVGAFDGFHLGHQYLLNRACALARERDYESGMVTFEPIPAEFFAPVGAPPKRLVTRQERIALAASLCCDMMAILEFNLELSAWSADLFIDRVLAAGLNVRLLIASSTHTMGHDRADIEAITALCARHGIEVLQPPMLQLEELRVSSTEIREELWQGRVEEATTMLGRHYSFAGPVTAGRGVGATLGFPTANVQMPPEKLIPKSGVYAALASDETPGVERRSWPTAVFIGAAVTFGLEHPIVEAHLIAEEPLELVDHTLRIELVRYLREQNAFASPEALARQIAEDVEHTRRLCHVLEPRSGFPTVSPFCPNE